MQKSFRKNVFVIGAGAHKPYDFPTSKELTKKLKSLYSPDLTINGVEEAHMAYSDRPEKKDKIRICRLLRDLKLVEPPEKPNASNSYDIKLGQELDAFLLSFGRSQVYSIDSFLSKNIQKNPLKFSELGKLIISYFISKYEQETPIGFHDFNWIQYIINEHVGRNPDDFFKNPPIIFTFNYDNFFEKSLLAHLHEFHSFAIEDGIKAINGLNIRHIYGHIDSLGSVSMRDPQFYKNAIANIKVIGEDRASAELHQTSHDFYTAVCSAENVYFLGFGFDTLNTSLLFSNFPKNFSKENEHINFYSSNIGLEKTDFIKMRDLVPVNINFFQRADANKVDSLTLLSEKAPLVTN